MVFSKNGNRKKEHHESQRTNDVPMGKVNLAKLKKYGATPWVA
jgi:hypothetical protein